MALLCFSLYFLVFFCFLSAQDEEDFWVENLTPKMLKNLRKSKEFSFVYAYFEKIPSFKHRVMHEFSQLDFELTKLGFDIENFFLADCSVENSMDICAVDHSQTTMHWFFGIWGDRLIRKPLYMDDKESFDSEELRKTTTSFFESTWNHFHPVFEPEDFDSLFDNSDPEDDWLLCFGNKNSRKGMSFCHTVGQKSWEEGGFQVAYFNDEIIFQGLENAVGVIASNDATISMFGLWLLQCPSRHSHFPDCNLSPYYGTQSPEQVHTFLNTIASGTFITEWDLDGPFHLTDVWPHVMYYFHLDGEESKGYDAAEKIAMDLVGNVEVLFIDSRSQSVKDKAAEMSFDLKPRDKTAIFLQFGNPDEEIRDKDLQKAKSKWDPVSFVRKMLVNRCLTQMNDSGIQGSTMQDNREIMLMSRQMVQLSMEEHDDETEVVLLLARDPECWSCSPPFGMAQRLNPQSLSKLLSDHSTAMVYFWINSDTESRFVLNHVIKAANELDGGGGLAESQVGTVACHDWPDLCAEYQVMSWPTLALFQQGKWTKTYKGTWDVAEMINAFTLFSELTVFSVTKAENFYKLAKKRHLVIVGLFKDEKSEEFAWFQSLASSKHGQYSFGAATGSVALQIQKEHCSEQSLPILAFLGTYRQNSMEFHTLASLQNEKDLDRLLARKSRPLIISLSESSFPSIWRDGHPLVVVFLNRVDLYPKLYEMLSSLASAFENIQFSVLETSMAKNLSKSLMKTYDLTPANFPALILRDFRKAETSTLKNADTLNKENLEFWLAGKEESLSNSVTLNPIRKQKTDLYADYHQKIYLEKEKVGKVEKFEEKVDETLPSHDEL